MQHLSSSSSISIFAHFRYLLVSQEPFVIMADWDADDFEPGEVGAPKVSDKWEGEDEDDDIKVTF